MVAMFYSSIARLSLVLTPLCTYVCIYGAESSLHKDISARRHALRIVIKMRSQPHNENRGVMFDRARSPRTTTFAPLPEATQKIVDKNRSQLMKQITNI